MTFYADGEGAGVHFDSSVGIVRGCASREC